MDAQTRELLRSSASALQVAATMIMQLEVRLVEVEVARARENEGPERLFTPCHVAELLSVSESKVYEMLNRGELPSVWVGPGHVRVPLSAYRSYVERLGDERKRELRL